MPELMHNPDMPAAHDLQSLKVGVTPHVANAMIVYGGGGHGKAVIDLLRSLGSYELVGIVDDGLPAGSQVLGVPVLGGAEVLESLAARGIRLAANAVGGIGNINPRLEVFAKLSAAGFSFPTLVHPSAVVEASADLADGAPASARSCRRRCSPTSTSPCPSAAAKSSAP